MLTQGDPLHQPDSSSRRKPPSASAKISATISAKMASYEQSRMFIRWQEDGRKKAGFQVEATSPEATNPEAPVLSSVRARGAKISAKLAALNTATDAPQLNITRATRVWKPRNDIFGSSVRKLTFDKNATGLPPPRSITDLP